VHNLYKVLGIASTADAGRIKSEFRRRAKAVHPDLNPGQERAEERFHELMRAYEVLRNDKARADYDALLSSHRRESRRRFAQSAGLMAATFVLTMVSGFSVMGLQGLNVHSQTWQIATAWLTSVEVEPTDRSGQASNRTAEGTPFTTTIVASAAAGSSSHSASDAHAFTSPDAPSASSPGRKAAPEAAARRQHKAVAAAERRAAPGAEAPGYESWMPWSSSTDEQQSYYGLGASGLR
jgi:curved DNA-binding protein CbpA